MAFDGVIDDGKLFAPGFANANPPGQTIFNLLGSAGTDIGNAGALVEATVNGDITMTAASGGGQVTVNSDGSITLASGITPTNGIVLIDADATVDINSATADVSIAANGGDTLLFVGVDNNITLNPTTGVSEIFRTGVIDFVATGVITNISTINGLPVGNIVPPVTSVASAGPGITVSPTTGDVLIGLDSSISVTSITVSQSIVLPGTFQAGWVITTDAGGNAQWEPPYIPEDLNVSTLTVSSINGVQYPAPAASFSTLSVSSLTLPVGNISLFGVTGNAGDVITADGLGTSSWLPPTLPLNALVSTLTAAEYVFTPSINDVSSISAVADLSISSPDSLNLEGSLGVFVSGELHGDNSYFSSITFNDVTNSFISNLSSINGAVFPQLQNQNLSISTLSAFDYVSTVSVVGLSSINGVAFPAPVALLSGLGQIGPGGTGYSEYWINIGATATNNVTATASVTATLRAPDGVTGNRILYANPVIVGPNAYIHVEFTLAVANDTVVVSWAVNSLSNTPANMLTTAP